MTSLDERHPRQLFKAFEGGAVYTAEVEGRFFVIIDESALDFGLEELADTELVKTIEFDSQEARTAYLAQRFPAPLTREQIQVLYEKYLDLARLEIEEFGVKPTEVRHLIGRLGEFYCALQVNGTLASVPNQHGFDVLGPDGRRISVKTTAQVSGFVSISKATVDRADDLMVVQYKGGRLATIYHGSTEPLRNDCRVYEPSGMYELDLSRARRWEQVVTEKPEKAS